MPVYYNYVYVYAEIAVKFFNKTLICIPDFTHSLLICNLNELANGAVKRV